jgi:hypothetical protein
MASPGEVANIKAVCHNGQTFVTWKDAGEGEEGAKYTYSIYRSDRPIGPDLAGAEFCMSGVSNNSAKLFGYAFSRKDRLDPAKPTAIIEEGGQPLPLWSGLAVVTVKKDGKSYYAVVATDRKGVAIGKPVPGKSSTTDPVAESVAPIQPVKLHDSKTYTPKWYEHDIFVSGTKGLPLMVNLHPMPQGPTGPFQGGDDYVYFSRPEWGYRDGLPGSFQVNEYRPNVAQHVLGSRDINTLVLRSIDHIEHEDGWKITTWFGYTCIPQWATHKDSRAYPFTERRMLWVIDWVRRKYDVNPNRIYGGGLSMGAWGSTTFGLRHPEIFAAIFAQMPRTWQRSLPDLNGKDVAKPLMDDGQTDYLDRMNMIKYVSEHHEDLPFYGWCIGRNDGYATWQEQVDMAKALAASRHGFAFAWNNGSHFEGDEPMGRLITKYYGPEKFALNVSYPAFSHSSIDDDLGSGELDENKKVKNGAKVGGINLGFLWKDLVDEAGTWSVTLSNDLAKAEMTVDVSLRRCQKFKARIGEKVTWTNSAGGSGNVTVDQWGLVTIGKVKIKPGEETVLTVKRSP